MRMQLKLFGLFPKPCNNSLLILFACLISCQPFTEKQFYTNELEQTFNHNQLSKLKHVVLIPWKGGCSGCVINASVFVRKKASSFKDTTKVIFTNIDDIKSVKIFLKNVYSQNNAFKLDKSNMFIDPKIDLVYPTILDISAGTVKEIRHVDPDHGLQDFM